MPEFPTPGPRPGPPRPEAARPAPPAAPASEAEPSPGDVAPQTTPDGESPQTGDLVVDAALRDLAAVDPADLDAVLAAGESVHSTLTSRLSDLGS